MESESLSTEAMDDFLLKNIFLLYEQGSIVTLDSLAEITGLNPTSLRTEAMRMRAEEKLLYIYSPKYDTENVMSEPHPVFLGFTMKAVVRISGDITWDTLIERSESALDHGFVKGYETEEKFAKNIDEMLQARIKRKHHAAEVFADKENVQDKQDENTKEANPPKNIPSTVTPRNQHSSGLNSEVLSSPTKILQHLNAHVYGQEDAKKGAAVLLWNHLHGRKRNCLFIGPSGCGKTEIFRTLREIYPQIIIFDSSNITAEGWSGTKKVTSVFHMMASNGFTTADMEHAIIVFDEFDKLCAPKYSVHDENVSAQIQSELLAMIEGTQINMQSDYVVNKIRTEGISFVFLGAFERIYQMKEMEYLDHPATIGFGNDVSAVDETYEDEMITPEDLIQYGVRTEIMGRIGMIEQLQALQEEDFFNILNNPSMSPLVKLNKEYGCSFVMSDTSKKWLARTAEQTGLGVRLLYTETQKLADQAVLLCDGELPQGKTIGLEYDISETNETQSL